MKKTLITLAAMVAFIALAASAQAYTLTWDSYTVSGVTVTPHGGTFTTKTTAGVSGLGVSGGANAEIGITEDITFTFTDQSQYVNSLSLSMLYAAVAYDDTSRNEIAKVTVSSGGVNYVYTLAVQNGGTSAIWTDLTTGITTTITADSPGTQGNGGLWTIANPFGTLGIDSIVLTGQNNGVPGGTVGANSDYCFYAMTTTPTPIPGAVWLLGTGLVGLVGLRRRFRS